MESAFQANPFLTDREKQTSNLELGEEIADIETMRKVEDAISAGMPIEYVKELKIRLNELNELEFDQLRDEAALLTPVLETIATSLTSSLSDAFKSFFDGSKNGFEAMRDMAVSVLDQIATKAFDIASAEIVSSIFGGLFGGVGGGLGALFGANKGGMVKGYNMGGMVDSYSDGGAIKSFGGIQSALDAESGTPVLAALHIGEQVLTDINGDAQYFRKLKASGAWDKMKNTGSYNYGGMVNSYNSGGNVQNRPTENKFGKMQSGNSTVVMNISTPDEGGFRRNEKQILRRQQEMMSRSKRRYG